MKTKRKYTVYTQELRDKAFQLYLEGKSNWEIKNELGIGDTSGVSRIKKQDNWEVRKKLLQQNVQLATQTALLKGSESDFIAGGDKLRKTIQDYAIRNAEILEQVRKIQDACIKYLESEDGSSPRSFSEAVHLWLEGIRLERSLIGGSVEEAFIVQVFDVLRSEINDVDLLKRIGVKLRSIMKS